MAMRSQRRTEDAAPPALRLAEQASGPNDDDGAHHAAALATSALAFATRCHSGQRRESDSALFIEHPLEVARLLRDAGCSSALVAAGLLHEVVEDAEISLDELATRFGAEVAELVRTVTEDQTAGDYRRRKQMLREQVRRKGGDAALLFAADKIAKVRELPGQQRRDRARFGPDARKGRASHRLDSFERARLEHYNDSLEMLQQIAPRHPLVTRLASELDRCQLAAPLHMSERRSGRDVQRPAEERL